MARSWRLRERGSLAALGMTAGVGLLTAGAGLLTAGAGLLTAGAGLLTAGAGLLTAGGPDPRCACPFCG